MLVDEKRTAPNSVFAATAFRPCAHIRRRELLMAGPLCTILSAKEEDDHEKH
jgi:hypothetical protein